MAKGNTTKNIMIVGVGGQGTLLTSRILGGITMDAGYDVKLSEDGGRNHHKPQRHCSYLCTASGGWPR